VISNPADGEVYQIQHYATKFVSDYEVIQEMHVIATAPDLYHILVDINTVQSLLQLLAHENTDIL
jgi:hypothetical protein